MTTEQERLSQVERWFPWAQRAIVLTLGAGGFAYAIITKSIEVGGMAGPLLMWGGYQELRRADQKAEDRDEFGEDGWRGL